MEAWKGTINQISWLMARMAGSGSVEVDYIRLLRTADPLSDEARLDALLVNGQALENFHPDQFSYVFTLPPGWAQIPQVEASAIHPGASVIIAQPDSPKGEASIRVFSQSGLQSSSYHIRFEMSHIQYRPYYQRDFPDKLLPEDWAARQHGYRATVAEGAFHLEIPGEAAGMPYGLGGLYVQDFDLRPYMTIQYQAPKALEVAVQLHGPDGTLSDSEAFFLPSSDGWTSYTFNLSALAGESWGYHLDSIHLSFTSPTNAYPLRFLMDEILVGDSANGKTFQLEIHQPDPFTVDLGADTSLHSRETLFLDAGPARSYWWNTGDSTRSILADSAGTYVVQVSDERHCLAADTIQLDWISGWIPRDHPLAATLCLYPNPAQELCFLELPVSFRGQSALLRICKVNGLTLYQREVRGIKSHSHLALDLRNFPEGVYLVILQNLEDLQGGFLSSRLLIQRH